MLFIIQGNWIFFVADISYKCHRQPDNNAGSHSIGNDTRWHWRSTKCVFALENSAPLEVVCVISAFCLINSPAFGKKKKNRSQTHITSNHPFTLSGCWHVTQLVTAWITLHEALGERITVEIQFCATSNVRIDPSDSLWYPQKQQGQSWESTLWR